MGDASPLPGGLYFFDFNDQVRLREVIVGAESDVYRAEVLSALGEAAEGIRIRKARLAFKTFEVVEQRRQYLWKPSRRRVGHLEPTLQALVDGALRERDSS